MTGLEEGFEVTAFFRHGEDPEYAASAVVYQDDPKIIGNVIVPQGVTVVKETKIAGHEHCLAFKAYGRTYCRTAASIYATGAAITIDRDATVQIEELGITNGGAIGQLQLYPGRKCP